INALKKPGRDMREDFPQPILKQKVLSLEDLEQGMEMQGTVRNVVDFGAFIDIGVGQDGLVHISKLANRFVKHPMDVVAVGDVVTDCVHEIDEERGRIAVTMVQEGNKIRDEWWGKYVITYPLFLRYLHESLIFANLK